MFRSIRECNISWSKGAAQGPGALYFFCWIQRIDATWYAPCIEANATLAEHIDWGKNSVLIHKLILADQFSEVDGWIDLLTWPMALTNRRMISHIELLNVSMALLWAFFYSSSRWERPLQLDSNASLIAIYALGNHPRSLPHTMAHWRLSYTYEIFHRFAN